MMKSKNYLHVMIVLLIVLTQGKYYFRKMLSITKLWILAFNRLYTYKTISEFINIGK